MLVLKKIEKRGKIALARFASLFLGVREKAVDEVLHREPERILVIRQHNQMGDMLLAVPAFRALRKRFPRARVSLVAASINSAVMENSPFVDEVLVYAKERNRMNPFRLVRFLLGLRRRRFDLVLVLNTVSFSITSMLLAALSGARFRIGSSSSGFGHDLSSRYYHVEMPLPSADELERMHESEHNLYPLSVIGAGEDDIGSLLVPTDEEEADALRLIEASFRPGDPFIVIHPGAGKNQNIGPPGNFAETVIRLREIRPLGVAAVRGPVDTETFDRFMSVCPRVEVELSTPSIGFLGALMKRAAVTLCNDTGIMHIAGAVGANCCAVFGPTDPGRWKPVNDNVVAVRSADGRVESVEVDQMVKRAALFIERSTEGSA
jgi:ADP-heptose:LPS heptosyltransferase